MKSKQERRAALAAKQLAKTRTHVRPGGQPHGSRSRATSKVEFWRDWEAGDQEDRLAEVDPEQDLPGSVYFVPDQLWGFQAAGREDHPGICIGCNVARQKALLIKGTDAATAHWQPQALFLVEPTPANGLGKRTAFQLIPLYEIRLRRVLLLHLHPDRGRLDDEDWAWLQNEMWRIFGPPSH